VKKLPTEQEVRRFFQESYYVTMSWNSETQQATMNSKDLTNFVYPTDKGDSDEPS